MEPAISAYSVTDRFSRKRDKPLQVPRPEVTVPQVPNRQPQPAAQPEPTNKGPAKISTQEEYNKLPPGALYVHPDGTVRRKRV